MTELSNQEKIELMKIALQTTSEKQGIEGIVTKTAETLVKDYFTLLKAINGNRLMNAIIEESDRILMESLKQQ